MREILALLLILTIGASAFGQYKTTMNAFYLSPLIPSADLVRAYPLWNEDKEDGLLISTVFDESDNAGDLLGIGAMVDIPSWDLANGPNGRAVIYQSGVSGLQNTADFTAKDIFVLAKFDGTAFAAYHGLISGDTSPGVLVSDNTGTKFADLATGTVMYEKGPTTYTEATMEAPMNAWGLCRVYKSDAWAMDGIQVGEDRAFTARKWDGWIGDVFIYSAIKTEAEKRSIRLYYDLKFNLWLTDGATLYFPDQEATGIRYFKYDAEPLPWDNVTVSNEYEDGGRSFNTVTDDPPRFWTIEFTGLTPEQTEVFDAFNDAARRSRTFSFVDKEGTTWTNVRIENYSRSHEGHKSWVKAVKFRLVKYP